MPVDFTILWPQVPAPEIQEIRFSYDFCRKMSQTFCRKIYPGVCWIDYADTMEIKQAMEKAKGDSVILITAPETVISPPGLYALLNCATAGHDICAPVYNLTPFPHQTAALPAQYVDMDTFLEIAERLSELQSGKYLTVNESDNACICFKLDVLNKCHPSTRLSTLLPEALKHHRGDITLATDALVHLGFQKAFSTERDDLVRLVPTSVTRLLDVGCAMGGYGKRLKQVRPEIFLTGVELNRAMAEKARPFYDEIHVRPMEDVQFQQKFDLINCGDILEHLVDPWEMLRRLSTLLEQGGRLVLSVPNVGHWSIVKALLQGKFQYIPLGLLCIGHIRWFTESSIRDSLLNAGFTIEVFERQQIPPTPDGEAFIRHMCQEGFGDKQSLETNEFIIRAAKNKHPAINP